MPTFRPGKPRIHLGLTGNIPALASATPIPWDNVVSQEGGGWNPLTPTIYTVTHTGLWLANFGFHSDAGTATAQFAQELLINGTPVARYHGGSNAGGIDRGTTLSYLADLVAGDTIGGQIVLSAGTRDVLAALTFLQATRLGPERWTG